jgi:zinc/manganese transport system permease protein
MPAGSVLAILLPPFFECLVLVGIHSYLGIHVIKRKVIFVDLAFAQIAALGTLIAFVYGIPPHTPESFGFALVLAAAGAALFSMCRFRHSRIPQEAIIGLVYAIAAATAILLIDKAPHGAEHLKEILTGSILWVQWSSIRNAAIIYALVGLLHYVCRHRFLLISDDPERAWEEGVNVRWWDFLFYLSFGVVITVSVDVAGVLIVFVFLVAPAILAMMLTDRVVVQLVTGWTLGLVVTTVGLVLAYAADLSTGPAVIAIYGITMIVFSAALYILRAPRRTIAIRNAALVATVSGGLFVLLSVTGTRLGRRFVTEAAPSRARSGLALGSESGSTVDPDPADRVEAILRGIELDGGAGAEAAIEYLLSDPPVFFRAQVVERLTVAMGLDPGFAVEQSMDAPANRQALEGVRDHFGLGR